MKKGIFTILAAVALAFGMSACNNKTQTEEPACDTTQATCDQQGEKHGCPMVAMCMESCDSTCAQSKCENCTTEGCKVCQMKAERAAECQATCGEACAAAMCKDCPNHETCKACQHGCCKEGADKKECCKEGADKKECCQEGEKKECCKK